MSLHVYFIQAGQSGPIKIGRAARPAKRLGHLQVAHYEELRLLASIPARDEFESLLHERFARWRIRGEWYRPDADGLDELIENAKRGTAPDWALPYVRLAVTAIEDVFGDLGAAPVRHGEAYA